MLKLKLVVLCAAAAAVLGCGSREAGDNDIESARAAPSAPFVVSFKVNFFPVQKALWIEDHEGRYIKTLHVSEWLRGFGEEFQVLTDWVEASKEAREHKTARQVDAFTEPTLRAGPGRVFYAWDLKDWKGERVPDGRYNVILQCDGAEGIVVTWKTGIEVGEEPAKAAALPRPEELPRGLEMYVEDVLVEYTPE